MKIKQLVGFLILALAGYFIYDFGYSPDSTLLMVHYKDSPVHHAPLQERVNRNAWVLD